MPAHRIPLDMASIIRSYQEGTSARQIATSLGVSDATIRQRLRGIVALRGRNDYPAHVTAAHEARRGATDSIERREARARTRETRMLGTSALEDRLASQLDAQSVQYIRQKAIGPYNVDFALPEHNLVIEVSGGGHNPRVRSNRGLRRAYIEAQGWQVLELPKGTHAAPTIGAKVRVQLG